MSAIAAMRTSPFVEVISSSLSDHGRPVGDVFRAHGPRGKQTRVLATAASDVEEVLPARFGGSSLDYQLLEREDEQGMTRLAIVVSPRIALADEHAVVGAVLDALAKTDNAADAARSVWTQADSLRVVRMEPVWTNRGKLHPLHIERHIERQKDLAR